MYRLALLIGWLLTFFGLVSTCPEVSIKEGYADVILLKTYDAQEPLNTGVRNLFGAELAKPESDPSSVIQERRAAIVDSPPVPSQARMVAPSDTPLVRQTSLPPGSQRNWSSPVPRG